MNPGVSGPTGIPVGRIACLAVATLAAGVRDARPREDKTKFTSRWPRYYDSPLSMEVSGPGPRCVDFAALAPRHHHLEILRVNHHARIGRAVEAVHQLQQRGAQVALATGIEHSEGADHRRVGGA